MEGFEKKTISYYANKESKISKQVQLGEVFESIKTGDGIKDKIEQIRSLTDKSQRDKLKGTLPMVTFSGLFGESRKKEHIAHYSELICIDIDNLKELQHKRIEIQADQFTYALFLSPSGNGLKVLIKVQGQKENHLLLFENIKKYYKNNFNVEIDRSCKDISRGAFLSFDPEIFINSNSSVFSILQINSFKMDDINEFLSGKSTFKSGNRNEYLFEFANICKNQKIDIQCCITYAIKKFSEEGFEKSEIQNTIKSAYESNYSTPNNKAFEKEQRVSSWEVAEDYLKQKYDLRYNTILNKAEYRLKNSNDPFIEINEDSIYRDMQRNNVSFSLNKLRSLLASDFIPEYDAFLEYFESLEQLDWDPNKDYIDELASFVKTDDDPWFRLQFKKMLVRSVACASDPKVFNKQVFILVHSMQNSGKSTFCRFLCPPDLNDYFTENIGTDKDSLIALSNNFIINMDELATFSRAEINTLKSMISRNNINVRLPYGRRQVNLPRRANFVGSTNKDEFLTDETGSVRWLCFELIDKIDFTYKQHVDMNLVWKQANKLYKEGFNYELTDEEIAYNESRNKKYQNNLAEYDLIQSFFMPCEEKLKANFMSPTEIMVFLKNKEDLKSINLTMPNISKALKMLGYLSESCYIENIKQSRKGYFIKARK